MHFSFILNKNEIKGTIPNSKSMITKEFLSQKIYTEQRSEKLPVHLMVKKYFCFRQLALEVEEMYKHSSRIWQ